MLKLIGGLLVVFMAAGCVTADKNISKQPANVEVSDTKYDTSICDQIGAEKCYLKGKRFADKSSGLTDYKAARAYFLKSSSMGYLPADQEVAWFYALGTGGEKDTVVAVQHMRKAAEGGLISAYGELGALFFMKASGNPDYLYEAEKWYLKGAKNRDFISAFSLGSVYQNRNWSKTSSEKAYSFFLISTAFEKESKTKIQGAGPQQHMAFLRRILSPAALQRSTKWAIKWLSKNAPKTKKI